MPTGACGINCDVCRLNRSGICSSCGGGTSEQARLKFEAQERLLGAPCPILACARLNKLDFCMRDCRHFPCENFSGYGIGGYPFSKGFLDMQRRRWAQLERQDQQAERLEIPEQHWQLISGRGIDEIRRCSSADLDDGNRLLLLVLDRTLRINPERKSVEIKEQGSWLPAPSLTAFVAVLYLAKCKSVPLSGRWVSEKDLSCREFFRGIHQLQTESVLRRFSESPADFSKAAEAVGGVRTKDPGDAAVRLWVFPAMPIKLTLWCGDDELEPALTVMFDQSIDQILPGDGIWALVKMVCETLAGQEL